MSKYEKYNGLEVKFGNRYLHDSIMIYNMGSSTLCPSMLRGLCQHPHWCYARNDENQYDLTLQYRHRQAKYWMNTKDEQICDDFAHIIKKNINTKYEPYILRINESGDFYTQGCIDRLCILSDFLWDEYGIITFGFSSRSDLDFKGVEKRKYLRIKGTNFETYDGIAVVYDNDRLRDQLDKLWRIGHTNTWSVCYCNGGCGESCFFCIHDKEYGNQSQMVMFKKHGHGVSKHIN